MPAGEIARHAPPAQGTREQSAGVTLAGRLPTTTEEGGGGGVPPSILGGGGGACRCERDHLPMRPWFPPPPWEEGVAHLCETEAGWGAGWRGHLSGDLRGPGSPCFQPPLPLDRGGGYVLCGGGARGVEGAGTMYRLSPGARPCVPCAGGRAGRPAGGFRPEPGAWVAAGGRGGGGAMRVRGPWRSRGGVGGPSGGRRWP